MSRVLCGVMSVKRTAVAAALLFAGLALAGCGVAAGNAAPTSAAPVVPAAAVTAWTPPTGMTTYGYGLAWSWTPKADIDCKSYQNDGCYGITVATQYGCPNGIYIQVSVLDASGASIDKANDITAGLGPDGVAKSVLAPPSGIPKGAKAKVTKLNCLG